jgi:predicted AlkP superfamily pyrophosphatase or phosphodiesterase
MVLAILCGQGECPPVWAASPDASGFGNKHVLVIGIDGCRSDALRAAKIPNIKSLTDNGTVCYHANAGGELGGETQQPTISGPCWSSICTGVWVNKHNVPNNEFKKPNLKTSVDGKIAGYPHFFTRLKEKSPTCFLASIVHWAPINTGIVSDADFCGNGSDAIVAQKCAELLLGNCNPAVVFLQFDDVDGAGHSSGYGPQSPNYVAAIETVDGHIGTVLNALKERPQLAQENWLILVTADHGGRDKKHGGQSPEERTVFLVAYGGGYPHKVLETSPGIVVIPPTVFRHLGVPVDPAWGWEEPDGIVADK